MKISEIMTRSVHIAAPQDSIRRAAQAMADIDAGALPVGENDRLVGMITDRDIAVRAVALGKSSDTPVRDVMSTEIRYCFDDQELTDVAANMAEMKVRRLPVVDRDKKLVGIVSLGDVALADGDGDAVAGALCGISEPGGQHSQSSDGGRRHSRSS
jgi:CBS domain-containing protein